jgi:CubicO group peptidase (beta-lactamase class C family)
MKLSLSLLLLAGFLLGQACLPPVAGQPLPLARPAALGFSPQRLDRLHGFLEAQIEAGRVSGAIVLLARQGQIVDWQAFGQRDLAAAAAMERDTIVRIYSMSKLVTSVAVLTLFEEGRFKLDDPITKFIPELASLQVFTGGTADAPQLEPARAPLTIKQLLTHTAGFTYDFGDSPLEQLYKRADLWGAPNFKAFIERAAKLPLAHHPGERWTYGINTDVLGYLVEVVSGQPFEAFLEERLFRPLRLPDTGFLVPPEKQGRLARIYELGPEGKLRPAKPILDSYRAPGQGWPSGGAGLFSTIGDFARFGQMLLNGGRLEGTQVLGRKTVELMLANHLNHLPSPTHPWNVSEGFGLGGSVRLDLAKGNNLGSVGQFGWSGAATTYFNLDPHEDTLALLFLQHFPYDQHGLFPTFSTLFYQALVD